MRYIVTLLSRCVALILRLRGVATSCPKCGAQTDLRTVTVHHKDESGEDYYQTFVTIHCRLISCRHKIYLQQRKVYTKPADYSY